MKDNKFELLDDEILTGISGGNKICAIFDPNCWLWPAIKNTFGMIKPGPTRPTTCIPRSSWNPVPPVPCP